MATGGDPAQRVAVTDPTTGTLYGDCAVKVLDEQPATAEVGVDWEAGTTADAPV